ncbi:MAG: cytochrome b/b6 domain-containing protein [Pseudomonadota bacterium]|jgi:cytochrome b
MQAVHVWDVLVRIFHWGLVAAVLLSFYTMKTDGAPFLFPIEIHAQAGYVVLGLLTFRWIWAFFGTHYARFRAFLVSPKTSARYAKSLIQRQPAPYAGHNPLGGWAVLILMLSLTFQAVSGLFLSDDIFFSGPLYGSFGNEFSSALVSWHELNAQLLMILIGLHLVAIAVHAVLGERLVKAMFTGVKTFTQTPVDSTNTSIRLPIISALIAILAGVGISAFFWL